MGRHLLHGRGGLQSRPVSLRRFPGLVALVHLALEPAYLAVHDVRDGVNGRVHVRASLLPSEDMSPGRQRHLCDDTLVFRAC